MPQIACRQAFVIYKRYNFFKTLTELTELFTSSGVGSFQRAPKAARATGKAFHRKALPQPSAHDLRLSPATRLSPLLCIIFLKKFARPCVHLIKVQGFEPICWDSTFSSVEYAVLLAPLRSVQFSSVQFMLVFSSIIIFKVLLPCASWPFVVHLHPPHPGGVWVSR